jgi:putative methyltransferase (TIGR04325 family)
MTLRTLVKVGLGGTFVGSALRGVPFAEQLYKRQVLFRNHPALFYGVYSSYEEASADIPASLNSGWDNEESAQLWTDDIAPSRPSLYPVFFWLSILLREGSTLVDYGGSIGTTYYSYKRFLDPPAGLTWHVVEVPHIAESGRRIAEREGSPLVFSSEPGKAPPADILLAAGAIQYMKESLPGFIDSFVSPPKRVIVNKVPLTDGPGYWTLQNFGTAVSPYQVYNKAQFFSYFEQNGYVVKDRWEVHEMDCFIAFHPERCVRFFHGLYFEHI